MSNDKNSERYASFAALRTAHSQLIQQRRDHGIPEEQLDNVVTLVRLGRATGALLDNAAERQAAQSLLDYWDNVLYRAGEETTDPTLDDYDPALAPELPDKPCPYVGLYAFRESDAEFFFGR